MHPHGAGRRFQIDLEGIAQIGEAANLAGEIKRAAIAVERKPRRAQNDALRACRCVTADKPWCAKHAVFGLALKNAAATQNGSRGSIAPR